jgi:ribosomal protein L34E
MAECNKKVNASKRTVYLQIAQMARQYYKPNRPCGGALQMRALTLRGVQTAPFNC